jgi:hypothetical protein
VPEDVTLLEKTTAEIKSLAQDYVPTKLDI